MVGLEKQISLRLISNLQMKPYSLLWIFTAHTHLMQDLLIQVSIRKNCCPKAYANHTVT